jgi:hypothetical protein
MTQLIWYVIGDPNAGKVPTLFDSKEAACRYAAHCFPNARLDTTLARVFSTNLLTVQDVARIRGGV